MNPRAATLLSASVLLLLSTGFYVAHSIRDARLRSTGAYAVVMERVARDAEVGTALGRPITRGMWIEVERAELLTLRIPLQGNVHDGTITLVASADGANVEEMLLEVNGQRTDLLAIDAQKLLRNSARGSLTTWRRATRNADAGHRHIQNV